MPPRHIIRITPRASADLQEIFEYIERDSPQNARSVATKILDLIDSLEIFPRRFRIHRSSIHRDLTIHSVPIYRFIIYYRVSDTRRSVEVIAICHGSRGTPRNLK